MRWAGRVARLRERKVAGFCLRERDHCRYLGVGGSVDGSPRRGLHLFWHPDKWPSLMHAAVTL